MSFRDIERGLSLFGRLHGREYIVTDIKRAEVHNTHVRLLSEKVYAEQLIKLATKLQEFQSYQYPSCVESDIYASFYIASIVSKDGISTEVQIRVSPESKKIKMASHTLTTNEMENFGVRDIESMNNGRYFQPSLVNDHIYVESAIDYLQNQLVLRTTTKEDEHKPESAFNPARNILTSPSTQDFVSVCREERECMSGAHLVLGGYNERHLIWKGFHDVGLLSRSARSFTSPSFFLAKFRDQKIDLGRDFELYRTKGTEAPQFHLVFVPKD